MWIKNFLPLLAGRWPLAAAAIACASAGAGAFVSGPPPGQTGGFGETTCLGCHFDNAPNDAGGSLTIDGVPPRFTPGKTYNVVVELRRPQLERGGFQLTSRFDEGPDKGRQAGMLASTDPRVQRVEEKTTALQFLQHTESGTIAEGERISWTIEWSAPEAVSHPVVFHVAANASNNDGSPLGDFIYTVQARTEKSEPPPE